MGRHGRTVIGIVEDEAGAPWPRRVRVRAQPYGEGLDTVLFAAGEGVVGVAVRLAIGGGDPREDRSQPAGVRRDVIGLEPERTDAGAEVEAGDGAGRPGFENQGPAGGVSTKQGALRPLQDLGSGEVEQGDVLGQRRRNEPLVEIDRDPGIRAWVHIVRTDAADEELGGRGSEDGTLGKTGGQSRDIGGPEKSRLAYSRRVQSLNTPGHVFHRRFRPACGDDHFVQHLNLPGRIHLFRFDHGRLKKECKDHVTVSVQSGRSRDARTQPRWR